MTNKTCDCGDKFCAATPEQLKLMTAPAAQELTMAEMEALTEEEYSRYLAGYQMFDL